MVGDCDTQRRAFYKRARERCAIEAKISQRVVTSPGRPPGEK